MRDCGGSRRDREAHPIVERLFLGTSWHKQLDGLMSILGPSGREEGPCPGEKKLQE